MLTLTILDGDVPIATVDVEEDQDKKDVDTGRYAPLAVKAAETVAERLVLHDATGAPMRGRVTWFSETDFGAGPLCSIGIALAEQYVHASTRTPMVVSLRDATIESFVQEVFDHELPREGYDPWYYGSTVHFDMDAQHQLDLLAELFGNARSLLADFSPAGIVQGLWCMMGGVHNESFTGLVWNPALPLSQRRAVIRSVYDLYDQLLCTYPYEEIDFRHPDGDRAYEGIDYMVPDLLLSKPWFPDESEADQAAVSTEFLELFARMLEHEAPVAQYAALHGLGHLEHPDRSDTIDRYLAAHSWLEPDQREYALNARRGDVL